MELKFEVQRQRLSAFTPVVLVSDSVGYLTACFTFSDDWAGLDRWVHLRNSAGHTVDAEMVEDRISGLDLTSGRWELWVHGHEKTEGTPGVRIVTNAVAFTVQRSGAVGDILPDIPLSAQEQIAANAANAVSEVRALRRDMDSLAEAAIQSAGSAESAKRDAQRAGDSRREAERAAAEARSWAEGGTGQRPGEAENNARYWCELALRSDPSKVAREALQTAQAAEKKVEILDGSFKLQVGEAPPATKPAFWFHVSGPQPLAEQ